LSRILIVDDEPGIRDIIKHYATAEGYTVDEASDGRAAVEMASRAEYAAILLDVMMPEMDGWTACREIRRKSTVPILMLTARGEEYDRLFGFELGVDDYIVKPFSPREVIARVRAISRRTAPADVEGEDSAVFGGVHIDYAGHRVKVDGELVPLTPKEYDLLVYLTRNAGRVFTRNQLLNEVWRYDFYGDSRTVDTHIKTLRERLGPYRKSIVTVWGTGYKFEPEATHK
jgi:DNA-binding response OmpR family regulator